MVMHTAHDPQRITGGASSNDPNVVSRMQPLFSVPIVASAEIDINVRNFLSLVVHSWQIILDGIDHEALRFLDSVVILLGFYSIVP